MKSSASVRLPEKIRLVMRVPATVIEILMAGTVGLPMVCVRSTRTDCSSNSCAWSSYNSSSNGGYVRVRSSVEGQNLAGWASNGIATRAGNYDIAYQLSQPFDTDDER